jgi:hypothetical protein
MLKRMNLSRKCWIDSLSWRETRSKNWIRWRSTASRTTRRGWTRIFPNYKKGTTSLSLSTGNLSKNNRWRFWIGPPTLTAWGNEQIQRSLIWVLLRCSRSNLRSMQVSNRIVQLLLKGLKYHVRTLAYQKMKTKSKIKHSIRNEAPSNMIVQVTCMGRRAICMGRHDLLPPKRRRSKTCNQKQTKNSIEKSSKFCRSLTWWINQTWCSLRKTLDLARSKKNCARIKLFTLWSKTTSSWNFSNKLNSGKNTRRQCSLGSDRNKKTKSSRRKTTWTCSPT